MSASGSGVGATAGQVSGAAGLADVVVGAGSAAAIAEVAAAEGAGLPLAEGERNRCTSRTKLAARRIPPCCGLGGADTVGGGVAGASGRDAEERS